jgi:hypothetical protein
MSSTRYSVSITIGNGNLSQKAAAKVAGIARIHKHIMSIFAPVDESPPERKTAQTIVYGILRKQSSRAYIIMRVPAILTVVSEILPLMLKRYITFSLKAITKQLI